MKKPLLYLLLLPFCLTQSFAQIKVGRTVMDYEISSYHNDRLIMNGAGERSFLFVELYSAALYLKNKSDDALGICYADEDMALALTITSKMVDRETFVEAVEDGFNKATDNNPGPILERKDKLLTLFRDPIKKGDKIKFSYENGVGTHLIKNDLELGIIEGQDFKFALFKIWMGKNPVNQKLKNGLLGES